MAQFVPPTPKEEAPSYLGYSRGYSSSDVMAGAETSLGKLFGNIGGVVDAGVKGVKQAFDESIKSDAYALIDPIRAAHGGDLAPGEVIPIAGTGARGAKYEAAGGVVGEDLDMGAARPLPKEAQTELNGLRKMKAAYEGGGLSNSHYSASLLAAAKELRAKYPGFREEVDAAFKGITGQDPANALRSSILSDMNSMAAASSSQANKMMTQYRADAEYWGAVKPNLSFEEYSANWQQWQTQVASLKAGKFTHEWKMREYEMESKGTANKLLKADDAATNYAANLVSSKFAMSLSQLDEKFRVVAGQGDKVNATALEQLTGQASALKVRMTQEFLAYVNKNIPDLPQEKRKAIIENTINAPIDTIQTALQNKETGVAFAAARITAQAGSQATLKIEREFPSALAIKGWRGIVGDVAAGSIYNTLQGDTVPRALEMINNNAFGVLANTESGAPVPKASEVIRLQQQHGVSSGAATKMTLKAALEMAKSSDPERAYRAVQFAHADPNLWKNLSKGEASQLYALLGSRDFTNKMIALGDKKPEAWDVYQKFMTTNFPAVAAQGMGDLQSAIKTAGYNVNFHPDSWKFSVSVAGKKNDPYNPNDPAWMSSKINSSLALLRPVLEQQYKGDAQKELFKLFEQSGVDFNAKQEGSLGYVILKGIGEKIKDWASPFLEVDPQARFKEREILGIDVQDIPEGMSAREFIKKLQKQNKT